jgi:hypothetical protein
MSFPILKNGDPSHEKSPNNKRKCGMKEIKLPESLINKLNFEELYSLRPDVKSKIILYDKTTGVFRERQIFRSYMSYLNTPKHNPDVKKSYMFLNKSDEIPKIFLPLLEYVKTIDARYNQMVVNWYEPDEYIELHRDCTSSMVSPNAPILMVNLNETDDIYNIRTFHMISAENEGIESKALKNNYLYEITNNKTHRHYTGKGVEKRISITFRMIKENNS